MNTLNQRKGRKQWQKNAYTKAHNKLKKTLIEATQAMKKHELHKATGLSRVTIDRHLNDLIKTGQVVRIGKTYCWGDIYRVIIKGLKADALLIDDLETATQSLMHIIDQMSVPTNILRLKEEGNLVLSDEVFEKGYLTGEELKELLDHKQKVFGGLRRSFFELAKLLMKLDVGVITVEEDLSNVEIRFIDGQPVWTVLPEWQTKKFYPT